MNGSDSFEQIPGGLTLEQAFDEANRCLLCHDPPCSRGCPGGTDPGTFLRKLRMRNVQGAFRTIRQNNVLGGACGVLCPTEQLCEKECSASGIDRPIRIARIQRALVEHGWRLGYPVVEHQPAARTERVAVVGSGPAGLACAAELARQGFPVTVFEAREKPGGVLAYGVPSYRLSPDFLARELQDLAMLGVQIRCSSPIAGPDAATALLQQGFAALFLAPGCWEPLRLLPVQKPLLGLLTATEFLAGLREASSFGASRKLCAGAEVAVLGGGSVAIDCAEAARRLGARDVYLVYRRSYVQMPAQQEERLSALEHGIHFLLLQQPVDYVDDGSGRLSGVKLVRTRLGPPDSSGRRKPVEVPGSEWRLGVQVAIEALGSQPEAASPSWYSAVQLADGRRIAVDPQSGETSVEGVYAGGDIVRGPALVIQAVKDGKAAARAIAARLPRP